MARCGHCGQPARKGVRTATEPNPAERRALLAAARPAYAVERRGRAPKRFSTLIAAQDYARRTGGEVRSL
jgi:hypothetical protein